MYHYDLRIYFPYFLWGSMDCIVATWDGDAGRGIDEGATVIISREHPKIDKFGTCTVAKNLPARLGLDIDIDIDINIEEYTWRLDVEVNYVQFYRVGNAINSFTYVPPTSSPSASQVLIGTYYGNSQQRRAINAATGQPTAADITARSSLNDAQKNAVLQSLVQRLLPIQGPPGTGKTQVADVVFRVWKLFRIRKGAAA